MNTATLTRFNINCEKKSKFFNEPMKVDYLYMMPKNNKILPPPAFQEGIKKHQCIVYHTKEDWLLCAKNKTPEWLKSYLRHIK